MSSDNNDEVSYDARMLGLVAVRATEEAAIAAAGWIGSGDSMAADQAAVDALRSALNRVDMRGRIVIGEGERDKAPMLYVGESVGTGKGASVDIAVDPLEATNLCVADRPDSLAVLAMAPRGCLLHSPDVYMDKLAAGPSLPPDLLSISASIKDNIKALASYRKVSPEKLLLCVLERERHNDLIEDIRSTGSRIRLIADGDIFGIIATTDPEMGVDMYAGIGGAPEGVLAAAALNCTGGFMEGRLVFRDEDEKQRARAVGIKDFDKIYSGRDLASGDVIFSATGVTEGTYLKGVRSYDGLCRTHSVMMRSNTGTIRFTEGFHKMRSKTWLGFRSTV